MKKSRVSNRLIAVLASLCLIFSSVIPATILSVGAADGDSGGEISIDVSQDVINPGDEFTVELILNAPANVLGGFQARVLFDNSALTCTDTEDDLIYDYINTPRALSTSALSVVNDVKEDGTPAEVGSVGFVVNGSGANTRDDITDYVYVTLHFKAADYFTTSDLPIWLDKDFCMLATFDGSGNNTPVTLTGTTFTDDENVSLAPSGLISINAPETANYGDTIQVSLVGSTNVAVNSLQYELSYDASSLKYVSTTTNDSFSSTEENVNEEKGTIRNMLVGINSANPPELKDGVLSNTVLATYTFEVIDATNKNAAFSFTDGELKVGYFDEDGTLGYVSIAEAGDSTALTDNRVFVDSISLPEGPVDLTVNEGGTSSSTLTVTQSPADNNDNLTYTWSTSAPEVATVVDGVVTAVGPGTATITVEATSLSGKTLKDTVTVNVVELTFDDSDATFSGEAGDTVTLSAPTVAGETSTSLTYTWSSSDEKIATVENGVITFVGKGEVTITVTASNGVSFSKDYTVDIQVPLTEVSLNADQVQLSMNDQNKKTADLDVTYTPEKPTDVDSVEWTSSDNAVATVDDDGIVTAVKGGKATITVTVTNEDGEKFTDTAEIYVSELSFELDGQSLDVQGTAGTTLGALAVTNTGEDITPVTYTYTSSNPDVMSVNANGEITLVSNGSATITIQASNGVTFTVTYNVRILVPMTGVTLDKTSMDLTPDEGGTTSASLQATIDPSTTTDSIDKIEWTSSDEDVATVVGDTSATVTAVAPGTATITVTVTNQDGAEFTATATVNVSSVDANTDDSAIEFAGEDNTLDMNDFFVVTGNVSSVTWSSSDETVATVDENGVVTFVGDGEVTITGSYSNGLSFDKTFTVAHDCADYLVHVDRVEPTTEAEGNIEYWYCSFCNKYYADAEGTQEISAEDTVLAKLPAEETPSTPGGDDTTSTPGGTTSEGTTSGGESTTTPQTGDSSNMMLWSSLAVLALLGLGTGVVVLKKKSRSK